MNSPTGTTKVELPAKVLKPGKNFVAAHGAQRPQSSDLYMDFSEVTATCRSRSPRRRTPSSVVANPKDTKTPTTEPSEEPDPMCLRSTRRRRRSRSAPLLRRESPQFGAAIPNRSDRDARLATGSELTRRVLTFKGVWPSDVHKGGSNRSASSPGKTAYGAGPLCKGRGQVAGKDGKAERVPIESVWSIATRGGPSGRSGTSPAWSLRQPDPEKDDERVRRHLTGPSCSLFPVTDCGVLQSAPDHEDEPNFKLETDPKVVPRKGSP